LFGKFLSTNAPNLWRFEKLQVESLPDTSKLIVISSDDEKPEDQLEGDLEDEDDPEEEEPKEDLTEDLDMGEPHPGQGMEYAGSNVSGDGTSSGSNSGEEPANEHDSDYDFL